MPAKEVEIGPVGRRVGAAVRARRSNRGMTLVDLSNALARLDQPINANSLARLERGERRVDVDELVALADALGMPAAQLLEGRVDVAVRPQPAEGHATVPGASVHVVNQEAVRRAQQRRAEAPDVRHVTPGAFVPNDAFLEAMRKRLEQFERDLLEVRRELDEREDHERRFFE